MIATGSRLTSKGSNAKGLSNHLSDSQQRLSANQDQNNSRSSDQASEKNVPRQSNNSCASQPNPSTSRGSHIPTQAYYYTFVTIVT